MNIDNELIQKIISMLAGCAFWVVIYLVSYFATVVLGLRRDLTQQIASTLKALKKDVVNITKKINEEKAHSAKTEEQINKIIREHKSLMKLTKIYAFDHINLPDVQTLNSEVKSVYDLIRGLLHRYNKSEKADVLGDLEKIDGILTSAEFIINAIREDEKRRRQRRA